MAHFAQIDENNVVIQVITVSDEHEENGEQFCHDVFGGTWKQTSYNGKMRKQYAAIGGKYDPVKDIFIARQPFASWTLNDESNWVPPVDFPKEDGPYFWNEDNLSWDQVE